MNEVDLPEKEIQRLLVTCKVPVAPHNVIEIA